MLTPNTILQHRYRVVRKLGQGGMGAIYEAIDERVNCVVALKETFVGLSPPLRQAFHREAALLANLRHPSLPKVMDYFSEGDGEFLVMEFIVGHDLLELLALRGGKLPQVQVLNWAIDLLKLLEYLHSHEPPILHRDIKPANLKATQTGELFLLDFGLAKGATGQMLTVETNRSIPGYTPIYSPLEQVLGQGTDQRSDLYAVGATLYHLLTGQAPASAPARFNAIENDRPDPLPPVNQVNLEIAPEVAICIQRSMALSVRDRIESASKMRLELEHAIKRIADREIAQKAEEAVRDTLPLAHERDPSRPLVMDEGVQFTVYAPQKIRPDRNYSLLAFAHLTNRRADAEPDEPDPLEEVKEQAARLLGARRDDYRDEKDASSQPVPRGGELAFVPVIKGVTFNPPSRSFTWRKSVHREEFDLTASAEVDGQTLRGSMTVFLGSVVIADVRLTISVDSHSIPANERVSLEHAQSARRVRRVFASYSHKDEQVVEELAHVAPLFGSRFLLDRTHLEPGEDRIEGLQRLIRNADVFQLFWSTNSMRSPEIKDEIRYAVALARPGFILPTYWEEPVPRSPAEGLPPPEIERLQFYRIYPGAIFETIRSTAGERHSYAPDSDAKTVTSVDLSAVNHVERTSERVTEQLAPPASSMTEEFTAPAQTMSAAPSLSGPPYDYQAPGTINCANCGTQCPSEMNFCNRCGRRLQATVAVEALAPTSTYSLPPAPQHQMPVARPKGVMMKPVLAAAAMVLLIAVVAPVWLMLNRPATTPDTSGVINTNSNANRVNTGVPSNINTTANVNSNGALVPDGKFVNLNGETLRLRDFRGRVVLLHFWATTTVSSRREVLLLNELQKNYGSRGLTVIGVSKYDTAEKIRQFQRESPQDYIVGLRSKENETQLPADSLPTSYIIDRTGQIRKKLVGPQTREAFEAAIEPILNAQL